MAAPGTIPGAFGNTSNKVVRNTIWEEWTWYTEAKIRPTQVKGMRFSHILLLVTTSVSRGTGQVHCCCCRRKQDWLRPRSGTAGNASAGQVLFVQCSVLLILQSCSCKLFCVYLTNEIRKICRLQARRLPWCSKKWGFTWQRIQPTFVVSFKVRWVLFHLMAYWRYG